MRSSIYRRILSAAAIAAAFVSLPVMGAPLPFQNSAAEFDIDEQPGYVPPKEAEQLPDGFERQYVFFRTTEPPGSIIVHTGERFLYLVQGNNRALRYGIGVGRDGFQWSGLVKVHPQAGMAGLATAAGNDQASALSPALHGRGARKSHGCTRALSGRNGLSHSRHEPAADHRLRNFVRMFPTCERRRC